MIIDSSALVAIALREPEKERFERVMAQAGTRRMSGGTWVELSAVALRGRLVSVKWLDLLLASFRIELAPVTVEQAVIGHEAYRTFGHGSGHRAKLNVGDCFTYALAKATGEPLLFKGDDFNHTDLSLVEESGYPR